MSAMVSRTSVGAFEGIALENAHLRAVVMPTLGGRVWELEDRTRRHQWIWHRPDLSLTASTMGAAYDDVWAGGWEELFPNDAPCTFDGRSLPDHGEWWTMKWRVSDCSSGASARVQLSAETTVIKASCTKEFELDADATALTVSYRILSEEREPFNFLFKQHLPVQLAPGCRLLLPGGRVRPVDPSFSTLANGEEPFDWPMARSSSGQALDLALVPPSTGRTKEFVYVWDLPDAWCGVQASEGRFDTDGLRPSDPAVRLVISDLRWLARFVHCRPRALLEHAEGPCRGYTSRPVGAAQSRTRVQDVGFMTLGGSLGATL